MAPAFKDSGRYGGGDSEWMKGLLKEINNIIYW